MTFTTKPREAPNVGSPRHGWFGASSSTISVTQIATSVASAAAVRGGLARTRLAAGVFGRQRLWSLRSVAVRRVMRYPLWIIDSIAGACADRARRLDSAINRKLVRWLSGSVTLLGLNVPHRLNGERYGNRRFPRSKAT
jgi:hypothetical protein